MKGSLPAHGNTILTGGGCGGILRYSGQTLLRKKVRIKSEIIYFTNKETNIRVIKVVSYVLVQRRVSMPQAN